MKTAQAANLTQQIIPIGRHGRLSVLRPWGFRGDPRLADACGPERNGQLGFALFYTIQPVGRGITRQAALRSGPSYAVPDNPLFSYLSSKIPASHEDTNLMS